MIYRRVTTSSPDVFSCSWIRVRHAPHSSHNIWYILLTGANREAIFGRVARGYEFASLGGREREGEGGSFNSFIIARVVMYTGLISGVLSRIFLL